MALSCSLTPRKQKLNQLHIDLAIACVATFVLSFLFIHYDFFDWWYATSRSYEMFEIDEILGIIGSILVSGSIVAIRHIFMLNTILDDLEKANDTIRIQDSIKNRQERLATLGELASSLAHEINNALQPTIGLGQFVRDGLIKSGNAKHLLYMETILDSSEHAKNVVENILSFSHEKNVGLTIQNATDILLQAIHFSTDIMPSTLIFELSGFYHQKDQPRRIYFIEANKTSLCQIFINIFKNASNSMDQAGTILVSFNETTMPSFPHNKAVAVSVTDQGLGMDADTLSRIFDPFFTTKGVSEGTGLGLYVVKTLMQQHNGEVTVKSERGHGTTFTLFFPIAPQSSNSTGDKDGYV